jgi:tRNA(His) guanylyltransferase
MYDSLGARMKDYENSSDYILMRRTPIICRVDGIGFSRLCKKLKRPYEPLFLEAMAETMLKIVQNIAGAVFAYQQSDEITIVIRNDQTLDCDPWYGNRVQKIATAIASNATFHLNKNLDKLDLDLSGDAIFDGRVFAVPTISEAVNNLIWRQQDCSKNAIANASEVVLGRKFGRKTGLKMLHGQPTKNRLEIIKDECGIDFIQEYPAAYRLGVGAYKVPVIFAKKNGENSTRKKWKIDWDLPNFVEDKDFIYNLIFSGSDVFRAESLKNIEVTNEL